MRHGWSAWLLAGLLIVPNALAKEITPQEVAAWEQDLQVLTKADEFYQYILSNDISSLEFALARLTLPQQEVVRFLLLEHMEEQHLILSPQVTRFVQSQLSHTPVYKIREQGDGYEIVVPVYNSSAVAHRLLKQQAEDHAVLDFVLLAEQNKLHLQDWLSGQERKPRENLLVDELDSLSPQAFNVLTEQLVDLSRASWVPSSSVVAKFAELSQDQRIYDLLWRMRADSHSRKELQRLSKQGDEFAVSQMIAATTNPSLNDIALNQLTRIHPMPIEVKTFFVEQLQQKEFTELVATKLREQGHSNWLEQLATQSSGIDSKTLLRVLRRSE
ncbi:hypothetical protein [Vibrio sp. SCSIO 43136]|uniref:hypothetical protein n=1 Tax=Vibrio sp. SCSIO 43136 TaxID=2819101 RepID=UPI002075B18B|nr:hypothetical protein [Vibrio sp. SCSIO 43136]USD65352.1 hypothetical protein J4N39_00300 [Vibrio sp. SCSIO 43136]